MTPHELNLRILEYREWMEQESKEKVAIAYLTANLIRAKRMPNLKKLLGEEKKQKEQTPEQMLEQVKKLNASFGGEVRSG